MAALDTLGALPFDAAAPIWADLTPLAQSEVDGAICPILYSPEYSQAMDLLRALMLAQERSPRVLALTEHLIKLNPSNYTVWDYRAQAILDLATTTASAPAAGPSSGADGEGRQQWLEKELNLLDDLAAGSMKNYQIWQQRKRIVTALGDPSRELQFTANVLDIDAKNYHTWVYRQWVLCHFGGLPVGSALEGTTIAAAAAPPALDKAERGKAQFPQLWDGELAYTESLLDTDVRNNSAWNHRYFVLFASGRAKASSSHGGGEDGSEVEWVRKEIGFAKSRLALTPNNASAWNYLRGVARLNPTKDSTPLTTAASSFARSLIPSHGEAQGDASVDAQGKTSWHALEWLLDCEEERARARLAAGVVDAAEAQALNGAETSEAGGPDSIAGETAKERVEILLRRLLVADPMRKRFWTYKADRILNLLA